MRMHVLSRLSLLEFFDWLDYTLYSDIRDWEFIYKYMVNSIQLQEEGEGKVPLSRDRLRYGSRSN